MQIHELRAIFSEIIKGYSNLVYSNSTLYIRHFNQLSLAEVDSNYIKLFEEAKSKKIPTQEARLVDLKKLGRWTDKNEQEIKNSLYMLEGLENTKKNLFLESQLEQVNKEIRREKANWVSLISKKENLLGTTCEKLATQQVNSLHIFYSIFTDSSFSNQYFSISKFDELFDTEFKELETLYNKELNKFNSVNLKQLALSPLMQNYFSISENLYDFWGIPLIKLTIYQEELLRLAGHFHYILSNSENIPKEIKEDSEKLYDWWVSSRNLKKVAGQGDLGQKEIIGMKKKDKEKLGIQGSSMSNIINKMKNEGKQEVGIEEISKSTPNK